jgi:hypothetical protein
MGGIHPVSLSGVYSGGGFLDVGGPTGPGVAVDKKNAVGVWGYIGPSGLGASPPTQTSVPPESAGVLGQSQAAGYAGVFGISGLGGPAVVGLNSGFTGTVTIPDDDNSGAGVVGYGATHGVLGVGNTGNGVAGISTSANGVRGISTSGNGVEGTSTGTSTTGTGVVGTSAGTGTDCCGIWGSAENGFGVRGDTKDGTAGVCGTSSGKGLAGRFDGDVNINSTSSAKGNLTIAGDITSVGTITVQNDVILQNADCAEQFDMCDAIAPEPGTIVVIDNEGKLRESYNAYDKRVAGVVSGAGEYRPGIVLDGRASSDGRASVALVGKVFCKVDADFAPIAVGDLLTTSARPGFGMKATDSARAFGAVIGKALRPLRAGQGMIPILVALQ